MVRDMVKACIDKGVKYLTVFAFSTENWKRPEEEVSTLMELFVQYLKKEIKDMQAEGIRLSVIGDISRFPQELQDNIREAMASTATNTGITLTVAANYGGRWDIVQAVQAWQAAHPKQTVADLSEEALSAFTSTADLPEPDLLIRTGGESRISNFLLWQLAYAEFYFVDTLWPDFNFAELEKAFVWFSGRERRFGAVSQT